MLENKKQDYMGGEQLFGKIRELKVYLQPVNGVLVGSDLTSIQILEDLTKILNAKNAEDLETVLKKEINEATTKELDVRSYGYSSMQMSLTKLTALLKQIDAAYLSQSSLTAEQLRDFCKKQEAAMLKQYRQNEGEKGKLNGQITGLLELLSGKLKTAAQKAGVLKIKAKNNFERGADIVDEIVWKRQKGGDKPIDVSKLERVLNGEKERY